MVTKYRQISGPDRNGYTEIWIDEMYTRIQSLVYQSQAIQMVLNSRNSYINRDCK